MTFADVLEAARSLPRPEQVRLIHQLIDEAARPDLPPDDVVQRALALDFAHNPPPEFLNAMYRMLGYDENGTPPA